MKSSFPTILRLLAACLIGLLSAVPQALAEEEDPDQPADQLSVADTCRKLLAEEKFSELEDLAHTLRTQKSQTVGGVWKLCEFYNGVHIDGKETVSADFEAELALMGKWKAAFPHSITRPVAEAFILTKYAWKARGSGYANTVKEDGWRLFGERISRARAVLEDAAPAVRCPHWYAAMQTVALAQGWDKAAYDELFKKAVEAEPSYSVFYTRKAYHLLPRWYGNEGDPAAFADEAARLHPDGLEIYARIVWAQKRFYGKDFFAESRFDWQKTKSGFEALLARHPASKAIPQAYCLFACRTKERELARKLFAVIGTTTPNLEIWGTSRYFLSCKAWAEREKKPAITPPPIAPIVAPSIPNSPR